MTAQDYNSYCTPLVGQTLRSVEQKDYSWFFIFADEISIVTESPWRTSMAARPFAQEEEALRIFNGPTPNQTCSERRHRTFNSTSSNRAQDEKE
jgi:hypothetical protein